MNNNYNDSDRLIDMLKHNSKHGFNLLLDIYGGTVKTICQNILSGFSYEDIEEAVADCFIEFWKSADKIKNASDIRKYLIGITRHCAINKMRTVLKDSPAVPLDGLDLSLDIDVSDDAIKRANSKITQEIINSMPDFEREIFIRRYYLYERIKSIAYNMNCSEKKVENILFRYKEKLKQALIKGGINI